MYIEYDEYELLELFANEPTSIFEKEAGMFIYGKNDSNGVGPKATVEQGCILSHSSMAKRLKTFNASLLFLKELGYSDRELSGIHTLAAWDFGRKDAIP